MNGLGVFMTPRQYFLLTDEETETQRGAAGNDLASHPPSSLTLGPGSHQLLPLAH